MNKGRFQRHDDSGRSRATADRKDRLFIRSAVTAPVSSLSTTRRATRTRVSPMTVHRRLIERNLHSDESRFQLGPEDHRRRVWRRPWLRANPAFTITRQTGPQPRVMVWSASSFDSRTPLVVIRGTLAAQRYVDNILRTVLLPFLLQYSGLIFLQDNAIPHTARVAMNCLTSYETLPRPARLPDSSLIEHVGDMMGRQLHLPGNVDDVV
ncbi:transposable element Tc1 transposase [Trichonephila clavipes]|nr:transposable element Tc1 transposase [Trichonephila clavipes]